MNDNEFPEVKQFFGAYLHQDWSLEFASPQDAVSAFKKCSSRSAVCETIRGLDNLIAKATEMSDPSTYLWQTLCCYYDPTAEGVTVVQWLEHVRAHLAE